MSLLGDTHCYAGVVCSVRGREAKAGPDRLETAAAGKLLGDILRGMGPERVAEAEAAYRSCLATREKLLGLHHPDVAAALLGAPRLPQTSASH